MFNFTTNATAVSRALKTSRFVLFAYADILAHAFFYLFIISLLLLGVSLQSIVPIVFPAVFAMRLGMVFLALFLVFLELYLFRELYIKRPKIPGKLEVYSITAVYFKELVFGDRGETGNDQYFFSLSMRHRFTTLRCNQ